jgi:PIN domain nuclease of toxin-antitoxin system
VRVLLDTCASIWLLEQQPMSIASLAAIRAATAVSRVLVSPISAWEVGLLARRPHRALSFDPSPQVWFADLLALPGVRLTPLGHEAAIAASSLPGGFHKDPADRLLVATARELDVPLVTRDRRILDYAAQGHVQAIAC